MDHGYKEVPFTGQRISPWKTKSLPKFNDVPGRKFNGCPNSGTNNGEPTTPPPSPIGTFKYPALLRGNNVWPRDTIATEIRKSRNYDTADVADKKPQTLENFFGDIKPINGKTKMYLWPETKSIDFPKLDLTSMTQTESTRSLKVSTSEIEGVAKFSDILVPKKLTNFFETEDKKRDTNAGNTMMLNPSNSSCFSTMSTKDFDVILKHALSHNPVTTKHNSTSRIQRNMTFTGRPMETIFPIKKDISDVNKSLKNHHTDQERTFYI